MITSIVSFLVNHMVCNGRRTRPRWHVSALFQRQGDGVEFRSLEENNRGDRVAILGTTPTARKSAASPTAFSTASFNEVLALAIAALCSLAASRSSLLVICSTLDTFAVT
jgi:hypothetical protein